MTPRHIRKSAVAAFALVTTALAGAAPAVGQDFRTRDDAAPLMTAGLLARRPDLPPEMVTRYWRDVDGPLAARIHGFYQYWQHHLGAPMRAFWPIQGVAQKLPDPYLIFSIRGSAQAWR